MLKNNFDKAIAAIFLILVVGFGRDASPSTFVIPWPEVSSFEELKEHMDGKPTYVFIYSDACPGTPVVIKRIKMYEKIFKYKIIAWKVEMDTKLPGTPYQIVSVPQLNFFDNNNRHDALFGWTANKKGEQKFLFDFLNRTTDFQAKRNFGKVSDVIQKPKATFALMLLELGKYARFPFDLTGFDFSNLEIDRNMIFTGSDLRGVRFNNSNLDRVSFAGADLTGADFTGTKLSRIFWGSTICPDGTRSVEHGLTCEANLTRKLKAADTTRPVILNPVLEAH